MHVGEPGAWRAHRFAVPMGPEDLTWWPSRDELWTLTEHPHRRWLVALDRAWFDRPEAVGRPPDPPVTRGY